jgi:two-component system, LuxR family, response regulator FixJ
MPRVRPVPLPFHQAVRCRTVYLIADDEGGLAGVGQFLQRQDIAVIRLSTAAEALAALPGAAWPACVVSDLRMPGLTGLQLQAYLARLRLPLPLILITGLGDTEMAVAAVKAGAHDVLEKPFEERRLLQTIEAAVRDAGSRRAITCELADLAARRADLSTRQRQVMDLAINGLTNKEIGTRLGISPRTVEIYRAKVMERMGAATLADLVRTGVRLGDTP